MDPLKWIESLEYLQFFNLFFCLIFVVSYLILLSMRISCTLDNGLINIPKYIEILLLLSSFQFYRTLACDSERCLDVQGLLDVYIYIQ
jgi:hypothetical protein